MTVLAAYYYNAGKRVRKLALDERVPLDESRSGFCWIALHDPTTDEVLSHIDEVTAAMRHAGLIDRIADAAVAFSPGFFPAELWQVAEERLRAGLRPLYD